MSENFLEKVQTEKQTPQDQLNFTQDVNYKEDLKEIFVKDTKELEKKLKNMEPNIVYVFNDGEGKNIKFYGEKGKYSKKVFPNKVEFSGESSLTLDIKLEPSGEIQIGLNNIRKTLNLENSDQIKKYGSSYSLVSNHINGSDNTPSWDKKNPTQRSLYDENNPEVAYLFIKHKNLISYDKINELRIQESQQTDNYELKNLSLEEYNQAVIIKKQIRNEASQLLDGPMLTYERESIANTLSSGRKNMITYLITNLGEKYIKDILEGTSENTRKLVNFDSYELDTYEKTKLEFKKEYESHKNNYIFWNQLANTKFIDPIIEEIFKNTYPIKSENNPNFIGPKLVK